jgi:hypothetical protein
MLCHFLRRQSIILPHSRIDRAMLSKGAIGRWTFDSQLLKGLLESSGDKNLLATLR